MPFGFASLCGPARCGSLLAAPSSSLFTRLVPRPWPEPARPSRSPYSPRSWSWRASSNEPDHVVPEQKPTESRAGAFDRAIADPPASSMSGRWPLGVVHGCALRDERGGLDRNRVGQDYLGVGIGLEPLQRVGADGFWQGFRPQVGIRRGHHRRRRHPQPFRWRSHRPRRRPCALRTGPLQGQPERQDQPHHGQQGPLQDCEGFPRCRRGRGVTDRSTARRTSRRR